MSETLRTIPHDKVVSSSTVDIIMSGLNDPNIKLKLGSNDIQLVEQVIDLFPDLFNDIAIDFRAIIEDGSVDVQDIPRFISMATKLINLRKKDFKNLKFTRRDITSLIEAVLIIMIEQNLVPVNIDKEKFIQLTRSCMVLLNTTIDLDETINCSRFMCC